MDVSSLFITYCPWLLLLCSSVRGMIELKPESCYQGPEFEIRTSQLYNKNISVCRDPGLQFCYKFSYYDSWNRAVNIYGCSTDSNPKCKSPSTFNVSEFCLDRVQDQGVTGPETGRMCCTTKTKGWIAQNYQPVQSCISGTTNRTGAFTEGGSVVACPPRKDGESWSLFCVAKGVLSGEAVVSGQYFCDDTKRDSVCDGAVDGCIEQFLDLDTHTSGFNRTRTCCCSHSDCNTRMFLMAAGGAGLRIDRRTSFPGSSTLLYILLVIFGCIVLMGLAMMAGKKCGSSGDSIDFDDRAASFSRLDFDDSDDCLDEQPGSSPRPFFDKKPSSSASQNGFSPPDAKPGPSTQPTSGILKSTNPSRRESAPLTNGSAAVRTTTATIELPNCDELRTDSV